MNNALRFLYVCRRSCKRRCVDGDDLHGGVTVRQVGTDFILVGDDGHPVMDLDSIIFTMAVSFSSFVMPVKKYRPHMAITPLIR